MVTLFILYEAVLRSFTFPHSVCNMHLHGNDLKKQILICKSQVNRCGLHFATDVQFTIIERKHSRQRCADKNQPQHFNVRGICVLESQRNCAFSCVTIVRGRGNARLFLYGIIELQYYRHEMSDLKKSRIVDYDYLGFVDQIKPFDNKN